MPDVLNNTYWLYTVNPEADEPVMLINNHIGFDQEEGFGIMGDLFQRELLALDQVCLETNKKRIQVWINSPGGIVEDGMSIFSAIQKSTTKVDTYCVGMAASIAGVIFQAGSKRIMSDYAYLMYHNPYGSDDDKGMTAITDMIVTMIAGRTGKSKDDIQKMMDQTSWISAEEAVASGMCDKIEASGELNTRRKVTSDFEAQNCWKESRAILNKAFNISKNTDMAENTFPLRGVANKLKLNPAASDELIMEELSNILNKKDEFQKKCEDMEDEMTKTKRDIDDHKKELDALKEKHTKLKSDYDDLKKQKDDADKTKADDEAKASDKAKAENEDKAKNLIKTAAVEGRISKDQKAIDAWTAKAIADYDGVKALLDLQPGNRKAVKIETHATPGQADDKVLTGSVANKMQELREKYKL